MSMSTQLLVEKNAETTRKSSASPAPASSPASPPSLAVASAAVRSEKENDACVVATD
ncbi:MAG: hypothetical protein ABW189_03900 [Rickettsiales bacterium]